MIIAMHMKILSLLIVLFLCTSSSFANQSLVWNGQEKFTKTQRSTVEAWLHFGVQANINTFDALPFERIYFDVVPYINAKEPVPWAQVNRSDNSINLYIGPNYSLEPLKQDWTIYHEIAHLYLPFLDSESAWLSEGFATYMQQIIMLQSQLLTKQEMVNKIKAGLNRGKKNTLTNDGKLNNISSNMHQNNAYMRVYWSGTAYFLEADYLLHQQENNLSLVINQYINCCLTDEADGKSLIADLDRLSQSNIFSTLYKQYKYRTDFPDINIDKVTAITEYYNKRDE
jgi:M61 glycyl aminopeptidase